MSKYFTDAELSCKGETEESIAEHGHACGCGGGVGNGIDPKLYELLDDIRERVGRPVHVSCAYRCPVHDADVGGVGGAHPKGQAADIYVDDMGVEELAQIAEELQADGVGRYFNDGFVHIDVRDGRVDGGYRWSK